MNKIFYFILFFFTKKIKFYFFNKIINSYKKQNKNYIIKYFNKKQLIYLLIMNEYI
jgi:hypothetical protein